MDGPADEWRSFCQDFTKVSAKVDRINAMHVNSSDLRDEIGQTAQRYLRLVRPILLDAGLDEKATTLDEAFSNLLQLAQGRNALQSYKKFLKRVRKIVPSVTTGLALSDGARRKDRSDRLSSDEEKLLKTLGSMLPTAAMSYRQALIDLSDGKRVSFRGPALELREALREVLDHIAPDKDVMAAPNYKSEKDQNGKDRTTPTMKQKVRFILMQRAGGGKSYSTPADTAMTVDMIVSDVTRSVYQLSSVATHVASERMQVMRVKRYVEAVLHDLLEIN